MSEKNYIVLARKYRPQTFDDLIGQEVLVRTLTNAIKSGKLAQSYMLTGIRGIGKTTSARIIAKALNCVGVDGKGAETPNPCGVCEHCRAIAEDRHVDVQEIDAASNTGVDNAREIIEGTRYNPASARYKIYIIDEVHMLSKAAFNALLKTLEEPPEKVKFIFATTEIRKVPVTVLSRCQRFDLRRIDEELLGSHIAKKENVEIEDGAIKIVARLADGSVRDGLSLLDQAIAQSEGAVTTTAVREMVGISSKETLINLYESLLRGNVAKALEDFKAMYNQGYDPVSVVQDLLNLTHLFTKIKLNAFTSDDVDLSDGEKNKITEITNAIEMPIFTMFWQMLLKGIDEIRISPSVLQTVEMLLIRMCYFQGHTPTPDMGDRVKSVPKTVSETEQKKTEAPSGGLITSQNAAPIIEANETVKLDLMFETLQDVVSHAGKKDMGIAVALRNDIRVVKFEQGLIEFIPNVGMDSSFAYKLAKKMLEWTNKRWVVNEVTGDFANVKTIKEQELQNKAELEQEVMKSPIVMEIKKYFPEATLMEIVDIENEQQQNEEELTNEYDGDDEASPKFAKEA